MNPDEIPCGTLVLFDANALVYAKHGQSRQCRNALRRCADGELRGCVTVIALAEFCHRRMMQEAQMLGLAGSNPARSLAQDRLLIQNLKLYRREVEQLCSGGLTVIETTSVDLLEGLSIQARFGLLTNDSLHIAAARRHGIQVLISSDPHLDSVPGFTRYAPSDLGANHA